MLISRINSHTDFLTKTGPILFLHGQVNDEFITATDYVPKNLEWILADHLKANGFQRIVFYHSSRGLYALDQNSYLLSQAEGTKKNELTLNEINTDDQRPLKGLNFYTQEEEEEPFDQFNIEDDKPPFIIANDNLNALSTMEAIMKDRKTRTAVVIPHFEEIRIGGEVDNQLQERLRDWSKIIPSINKNKCIIVFGEDDTKDILKKLTQYNFTQLHTYLSSKINRHGQEKVNEILYITTPQDDEIRRLIHRRRLIDKLPINWKTFDTSVQLLKKLKLPLKELYYESLPDFDNQPQEETLEEVLQELDELVGLQQVKYEIREIVNNIEYFLLRPQKNHKSPAQLHRNFVFLGNPGTGKTTVARLIGRIFKALGLVSSNKFKEVSRRDLVAGFVGQTASKTSKVIADAVDGVLFIDEAYSLANGGPKDFGAIAIDELNKQMEDKRDRLIVIVAGYPQEMNYFFQANSGLASRFGKPFIHFKNYSEEELYVIFENFVIKEEITINASAKKKVKSYLQEILKNAGKDFGNGRAVRNLFERVIRKYRSRIVKEIKNKIKPNEIIIEKDIPSYDDQPSSDAKKTVPATSVMVSQHKKEIGRSISAGLSPALPTKKTRQSPPRIYLAFAHNRKNPLPALHTEYKEISRSLRPLNQNGAISILAHEYLDVNIIFEEFNQYKNEIYFLHYGGHADGESWELNTSDGPNEKAFSTGLANLFSQQKNLQCIFLNGCATINQVDVFLAAGIPAVIATSAKIGDKKATLFSTAFYESFASGDSLKMAFNKAKARVNTDYPTFPISQELYRGNFAEDDKEEFLWGLYYQKEEILDWCLPSKANFLEKELTKLPSFFINQLVGRKDELAQIHLGLQEAKPLLIKGIGGIGKSVLINTYLQENYQHFNHIAWINAQEGLKSGFLKDDRLISRLGLKDIFQEYKDQSEIYKEVLNQLQVVKGNNLLVIDSLEEITIEELEELPKPPNWKIVITSRKMLPNCQVLSLGKLSISATEELFISHCSRDIIDKDKLSILFQLVDNHPLVIELLAKTFENNLNIEAVEELIKPLTNPTWRGEEFEIKISSSSTDEEMKILQHIRSIFKFSKETEKQKGLTKGQIEILEKFAVLPTLPIPYPILTDLLDVEKDSKNQFLNELNQLVNLGWVERDTKERLFWVHPLIQIICLDQLSPSIESCASLINTIEEYLDYNPFLNKYLDVIQWRPYGERLLKVFTKEDQILRNLIINLCSVLNDGGNHQEVINILSERFVNHKEQFGQDDPMTLLMQMQLGIAYRNLGKIKESNILINDAELFFKEVMKDDEVQESPELMIFFQENLGITQFMNAEYKQSKNSLKSAIELYQKHYEEQQMPQEVLLWKLLQSHNHRELGEYDQAEEIAILTKQEIQQSFNDIGHPLVARANICLALVYLEKDQEKEAVKLLEEAKQILKDQYGVGHYEMVNVQSVLSVIYFDQGKIDETLDDLVTISDAIAQRYGRFHHQYAECKTYIAFGKFHRASLLTDQEELANTLIWDGLEDFREASQIFAETLGIESPFFTNSTTQMGLIAMNTDSAPEKIESLFRDSYNKNVQEYGKEHKNTLDSQFGLLFFQITFQGDLEALDECEEVLNKYVEISRPENIEPGLFTILYSFCLRLAGKMEKATEIFTQGKDMMRESMGDIEWLDTTKIFELSFNDIEPLQALE